MKEREKEKSKMSIPTKTVDDILKEELENMSKNSFSKSYEYHIRIARKPISSPFSISRGDFGCYIGALSAKKARLIAESHYPADKYSIVQVKPIA
ncbi:MAG: hypothetical protein KAI43_10460 [Candidatus Aureabacteria bacterium]|nr:hypothetical protein [Candidatus Auribacterota bacterium]